MHAYAWLDLTYVYPEEEFAKGKLVFCTVEAIPGTYQNQIACHVSGIIVKNLLYLSNTQLLYINNIVNNNRQFVFSENPDRSGYDLTFTGGKYFEVLV